MENEEKSKAGPRSAKEARKSLKELAKQLKELQEQIDAGVFGEMPDIPDPVDPEHPEETEDRILAIDAAFHKIKDQLDVACKFATLAGGALAAYAGIVSVFPELRKEFATIFE